MAKEGSVAPRERVNIRYVSATGDAQEERELPLKMLFVGDFTLRDDDTPVEERKPISIDKNNFDDVLKGQNLSLKASVSDKLSEEEGGNLAVDLKFEKLADFGPEAVAEQVPELAKLLDLRQALGALKGPLGNIPAFRKKIEGILKGDASREKILGELGSK